MDGKERRSSVCFVVTSNAEQDTQMNTEQYTTYKMLVMLVV